MNTRVRARQGMTIIEVMVSIVILAMIMAMVWGGFSQTAKNQKRIEGELDRAHAIRVALERITRELSAAFVSAQFSSNSSAQQTVKTAFVGADRGSGDRLDFTSFSHRKLFRDAHESDQNELGYFLTTDPEDSSRKVLARREDNRIDVDPLKGGKIEVFLDRVKDLNFRYYDPENNEWQDTWDTTQASGEPNRLPSQVEIKLDVEDLNNPTRTLTYVTRANIPIRFGLNHSTYNP